MQAIITSLYLAALNSSTFLITVVAFHFYHFRVGNTQTERGGAGETDRPHGEDRWRHRWHPALRHHLPRRGTSHEETVSIETYTYNYSRSSLK